ncbi:MAG: hypothetical protein U1F83_10860 [Verrucomicrobiota bacterium]
MGKDRQQKQSELVRRLAPLKPIAVFAAAYVYAFSVSAQGVIANDAAILPIVVGSGQYLTLTNSLQARPGLFAIQISSNSPSQYTFSYWGIAELYALYDVNPGVTIDPAFAAAMPPLVSNNCVDSGSSVQTFSLGQSRYYAYWDDRFYDSGIAYGIPDVTDNYGWVQITRTVSGLRVSSSATAIGGGIIAGTFTQVPEPTAVFLALLGLVSLSGLHRRT